MKFLLDENFPVSAVSVVVAAGHEAISFASACCPGDTDDQVFLRAQELNAVLLTSDRDFYHTVPLLHPVHHGIVVLSLRQPNRRNICERLDWFFKNIKLPIENKAYSLRDCTFCVRQS